MRDEAEHKGDSGAVVLGARRRRDGEGVSRLRGVGARLSLALLAVVAGALAVVYLVVVPSLRSRLVDSRISELERAAPNLAGELPGARYLWLDFLETAAASANARVVVYDLVGPPPRLLIVGDSRGGRSADVDNDKIALQSALSGKPVSGSLGPDDGRYAEAAVPVPSSPGTVLLLSAPLDDALSVVSLVRERLLVAGLLALCAALVVGYGLAWLFARRLRRLEGAAERIAGGRFDEPIRDPGGDEVGELARAFDRMRERLAALDHARREFVANASHELRTPLFSLGGFLELLTDEELDEETRREFLTTMRGQVDRLTKLASELLDLSRADAGRLHVRREPVDVSAVARAVVAEFSARARTDGRSLELEVEGTPRAFGDEQRVLQVGRILVENALVHTPPGTRVRVRAAPAGRGASLAVEDEGPGIPQEHAAHVFERFYRVDGRMAAGSGLGLAIAVELARLMGGSLELESQPGRTVFTLCLPAAG